ncbi:uncharacterized protein [Blastocystis hominis]|uniref:Uncharacterized protein n=1 Tax=Blastocystis hominis TaxID=12968 RepID=D8M4T1_BLAHO|nr:uncharacterized protein [Blastocystis hominis]CBK23070.2 unnamed protein product [Blastocystis hominis]|eukprot:XP_012897118.1 uncharacterized protein [Blastocystis hominis]
MNRLIGIQAGVTIALGSGYQVILSPDMMPIVVGIQSIRVDSLPTRGISEELLQELFKGYLQWICLFPNHT